MIEGGKTDLEIVSVLTKRYPLISVEDVKKIRSKMSNIPFPEVVSSPTPKAKAVKIDPSTIPLEQEIDKSSEEYWKNRCRVAESKYQKLIDQESVTRRLTSDIRSLAPKSYDPAPPIKFVQKTGSSSVSALLMLSDTHIGKIVHPDQTLEFGDYDVQVFLDRLQFLQDSVIHILDEHDSNVEELVVVMLGDMLDGGLHHGNEIDQQVTKFGQYYIGGHALAQFLRALSAKFPKIRIETCVGNHPRWDNQKKMPTKFRYSNLDMFLYTYVQSLTSGIGNIEWNLNMQPFQRFTVQNSTFFAAHGDHLRGGDKALGIPSHAFSRQLSNISQLLDKQDISNPDYYLYGHFHRTMQLPHSRGKIFVNGAFPGVDEFALTNNFLMSDPEQTLMLVHPKYKAADNWPIQLKFAKPGSSRYVLPQSFE